MRSRILVVLTMVVGAISLYASPALANTPSAHMSLGACGGGNTTRQMVNGWLRLGVADDAIALTGNHVGLDGNAQDLAHDGFVWVIVVKAGHSDNYTCSDGHFRYVGQAWHNVGDRVLVPEREAPAPGHDGWVEHHFPPNCGNERGRVKVHRPGPRHRHHAKKGTVRLRKIAEDPDGHRIAAPTGTFRFRVSAKGHHSKVITLNHNPQRVGQFKVGTKVTVRELAPLGSDHWQVVSAKKQHLRVHRKGNTFVFKDREVRPVVPAPVATPTPTPPSSPSPPPAVTVTGNCNVVVIGTGNDTDVRQCNVTIVIVCAGVNITFGGPNSGSVNQAVEQYEESHNCNTTVVVTPTPTPTPSPTPTPPPKVKVKLVKLCFVDGAKVECPKDFGFSLNGTGGFTNSGGETTILGEVDSGTQVTLCETDPKGWTREGDQCQTETASGSYTVITFVNKKVTPPPPKAHAWLIKKAYLDGNSVNLSGGEFTFTVSVNGSQVNAVTNAASGSSRDLGEFDGGDVVKVCESDSNGYTPDAVCITHTMEAGKNFTFSFVNRKTTPPPPKAHAKLVKKAYVDNELKTLSGGEFSFSVTVNGTPKGTVTNAASGSFRDLGEFDGGDVVKVCETDSGDYTPDNVCITQTMVAGETSTFSFVNRKTTPPPPPSVSITSRIILNQVPAGRDSGPMPFTVNASDAGTVTVSPDLGGVSDCNSSTPKASVTFSLSAGDNDECVIYYAPDDAAKPTQDTINYMAIVTTAGGTAKDEKHDTFAITYPTRV